MKPVYFIFGSTPSIRRIGWRSFYWMLRRKPIFAYAIWLGWWTQILTRSKSCHVSVSVGGVIYDSTVAGASYWAWLPFWAQYPDLTHYIVVWTDTPPDLTKYEHLVGKRQRAWKTILKYYSFGYFRLSHDCSDSAIDCMRQMGMKPPRTMRSPDGIDRWLKAQGREVVQFGTAKSSPRDSVAVDQGTRQIESACYTDVTT